MSPLLTAQPLSPDMHNSLGSSAGAHTDLQWFKKVAYLARDSSHEQLAGKPSQSLTYCDGPEPPGRLR